jgi:hypothetical protein
MIIPTQIPLTDSTQHSQERERETSLPTVGFEPAIPASERSQTHALDGAATGTGCRYHIYGDITGLLQNLFCPKHKYYKKAPRDILGPGELCLVKHEIYLTHPVLSGVDNGYGAKATR